MAINDYIDPMDRFSQGAIIDWVGDKEVAGGICRMLSIYWLIDCLKVGAKTPQETLHQMKANGKTYFQQIANAQKAYAKYYNAKLEGWVGSIHDCLSLASSKARDIVITSFNERTATTSQRMVDTFAWAADASSTTPKACIISFSCSLGNHCIAALEHQQTNGSIWYIFDPNYGVMVVDVSAGMSLASALDDIWNAYNITAAFTAPVK